ncbi:MAG: 30S ribosomal protein S3 [Bacillales bacterium]|nr:30S ribosomal protein S3 [Bacillales bacterium]
MGQKVSPIGLRIGIIRDWDARWYADKKEVADLLIEDLKIRDYIETKYKNASVSQIVIERSKNRVIVTVNTAKPGMVIGREGVIKKEAVDALTKLTGKQVFINVKEIKRPELDATLVARNIASQLENRASFRRTQKLAIMRALKAGAKGCKTLVSGRLAGAEIARAEGYSDGNVPLHTLRADIDYAQAEAHTTYGKLGVKVWIYKGEILKGKVNDESPEDKEAKKHAYTKKN